MVSKEVKEQIEKEKREEYEEHLRYMWHSGRIAVNTITNGRMSGAFNVLTVLKRQ